MKTKGLPLFHFSRNLDTVFINRHNSQAFSGQALTAFIFFSLIINVFNSPPPFPNWTLSIFHATSKQLDTYIMKFEFINTIAPL